jgi:hypothetical protein
VRKEESFAVIFANTNNNLQESTIWGRISQTPSKNHLLKLLFLGIPMTMAPEASKMTGRSVIRRNEKDQHLYWDSFSPNAMDRDDLELPEHLDHWNHPVCRV